ncbi:hypothetical protein PR048_009288 [Dryococelus australis]|uniref:Uncharacterized protein n=1 Tax=Dryococelus australis TaxID=614101 RepID=A0ABQ9HZJ2_9NEOP|nr:hypothetical protein PR048_009288 [Dryococelus australis]
MSKDLHLVRHSPVIPAAVAGALASHHGDPGSIPGGFTPGFSHVGIVLDVHACQRVFSGYPRFPRTCIPAPLQPRVSFHAMSGDDGELQVPAVKPVTRSADADNRNALDADALATHRTIVEPAYMTSTTSRRAGTAISLPRVFRGLTHEQKGEGQYFSTCEGATMVVCATMETAHNGSACTSATDQRDKSRCRGCSCSAAHNYYRESVCEGAKGGELHTAFAEVLRANKGNWSMERRRGEGTGETGDPQENSPTNGIVRHDSHLRKSGDMAGD